MMQRPTTYQVFGGTSGAADPHTLTKAATFFRIKNTDAVVTNTLTVSFNAGADYTMAGGETLEFPFDSGFVVQSFIVTAVVNTPTWKAIAFELP